MNTTQLRINTPTKNLSTPMKDLIPKGDLLPVERVVEIRTNTIRKSCRLKDKPSDAVAESVAINNTNTTTDYSSSLDNDVVITINSGNDKESLHTRI